MINELTQFSYIDLPDVKYNFLLQLLNFYPRLGKFFSIEFLRKRFY